MLKNLLNKIKSTNILEKKKTNKEICIRKYPFPFKCLLSINNDTDGFHYSSFKSFHEFVNGKKSTIFGEGLNLEISDSFWIYSKRNISLYKNLPWESNKKNKYFEEILELCRLGILDTLHGFGDWIEDFNLERKQIDKILNFLSKNNINLEVYVNHGGYNMSHNYAGIWSYYQQADNINHKSYCFDLLIKYGFKYFWADPFYELTKFGDNLNLSNNDLEFFLKQYDFSKFLYRPNPKDFSKSEEVLNKFNKISLQNYKRDLFNSTLIKNISRDGIKNFMFKRFRGIDGPTSSNFVLQVNPDNLDALERLEGTVILYQHFGIRRAILMGKGHESQSYTTNKNVLDFNNIAAFKLLAKRYNEGRILITTTRKLLNYTRVRDYLDFNINNIQDQTFINIKGINCPVYGYQKIEKNMLSGVTFQIKKIKKIPIVLLNNKQVNVKKVIDKKNGKTFIYFPWKKIDWPF